MSLPDSIFSPITPLLIKLFGSDLTFIRATEGEYSQETGVIENTEKRFKIKAIPDVIKTEELGGIYQATDARFYIDPSSIGGGVVTIEDSVEYKRSGGTVRARVVGPVKEYRGDGPILFDVVVRPE